jgi:hypothetical protein
MNMPISFNTLQPITPATPATPPSNPAADPTDPNSFAATLKQATSEATTATTQAHQGVEASHVTHPAPQAHHAEHAQHVHHAHGSPPDRPIGEEVEQVANAHEAKILSGKDKGMFLNEAENPRQGEAFRLEHHDGRWLHIYGSGDQAETMVIKDPGSETSS